MGVRSRTSLRSTDGSHLSGAYKIDIRARALSGKNSSCGICIPKSKHLRQNRGVKLIFQGSGEGERRTQGLPPLDSLKFISELGTKSTRLRQNKDIYFGQKQDLRSS